VAGEIGEGTMPAKVRKEQTAPGFWQGGGSTSKKTPRDTMERGRGGSCKKPHSETVSDPQDRRRGDAEEKCKRAGNSEKFTNAGKREKEAGTPGKDDYLPSTIRCEHIFA